MDRNTFLRGYADISRRLEYQRQAIRAIVREELRNLTEESRLHADALDKHTERLASLEDKYFRLHADVAGIKLNPPSFSPAPAVLMVEKHHLETIEENVKKAVERVSKRVDAHSSWLHEVSSSLMKTTNRVATIEKLVTLWNLRFATAFSSHNAESIE